MGIEHDRIPGCIGETNVPPTVDELTPEWLTGCLRGSAAIHDASVVSIDAVRSGDFGTSGEIRRLSLSYDRENVGAPSSLIAKFATGDAEVRATVHAMGVYEREARFYTELAPQTPVRTPRCYFASVDIDSGSSLLLLEDLSSLPTFGWSPHTTLAEAEVVIHDIASLHAAWWANAQLRKLTWLELRGITAVDQVGQVFESSWERFVAKLSIPLSEEILAVRTLGVRYLPRVWAYLFGRDPITLVHNDVQGANILFDRRRMSATFIDWQLATVGRGAVDVAHFLCGCLALDDRRNAWDRLVRMYHALLLEGGVVDYSLEHCRVDCRLGLLPAAVRLAAAVGIHPSWQLDPGAFWNIIFPRYVSALNELNVADLCAEQFT